MTDIKDGTLRDVAALRLVKRRRTVNNEHSQNQTQIRLCPYLGTINRHLLNFDFEKVCSVTLRRLHVYACLVCGKYYQGRGPNTLAWLHSLELKHYMFINLETCKIFCLPDDYEVKDAALDDIIFELQPRYSREEADRIATEAVFGKALDGTDFMPGTIGLNNLTETDSYNTVIQLICKLVPIRRHLLLLDWNKFDHDRVTRSLAELLRKIHNPRSFKGIASPHEFLQALSVTSRKQFVIGRRDDPLIFFSWICHRLHKALREPDNTSVVYNSIRGQMLVISDGPGATDTRDQVQNKRDFIFLPLNPPPAPIFKDSLDRNMIPQISIFELLAAYDGESYDTSKSGPIEKYSLWKLPPYLIFYINRFVNNGFFVEKNPTIVTFPIKNLDLREFIHPEAHTLNPVAKFNLVATICHQGKPQDGFYKIYVFHSPTNEWFEIEDLRVTKVLPQMVGISEAYIQLYVRKDVLPTGELDIQMAKDLAEELSAQTIPPDAEETEHFVD